MRLRRAKEMLRRIPRRELEKIQKEIKTKEVKSVPAERLLRLTGIASIGGDAVKDTERMWGNG
ncbi:MAG: hypothetical protein QME81_09735 [bacterium]|nr:hypothetical protein [bacterium]